MKYTQEYLEELKIALAAVPNLHDLYGKSVLITGCTGLIGSAIADLLIFANETDHANIPLSLAARKEARVRERFAKYCDRPWFRFVAYDALLPFEFPHRVDYVIHGASNAHPALFSAEPVETLLANVNGITELLKYARKVKTARVLYISSSEVYGRKEEARPYREDDFGFVDILNPRASYPSGKRVAETLCAAYLEEYGVDTVIVRPGHIYGPTMTEKDSRATAQFARDVLAGRDILLKSEGTQLRSYCYGADCASAILTVLLKGASGEAYNISNKDSIVSIRQIAEEFAAAAGRKVLLGKASVKEQKSYNLMDNSSLDAQKLERLGWHASFHCSDGVRRMLRVLKDNMGSCGIING